MPNIATWRNAFQGVSYPFVEGSLLDEDRDPIFPLGLLVDAQFVVPSFLIGDVTLTSTRNSGVRLELIFSIGATVLGTATALSGEVNDAVVPVIAPSGLQVGTLVFGPLAARERQKILLGLRTYTTAALAIENSCVFRFPSNVLNQINTPEGAALGKTALVEGSGIRLVKESDTLVRVDAVGDPEKVRDCCPVSGDPLRFLNEAAPTQHGEITLNVEAYSEPVEITDRRQAIRIDASPGVITFSLNT